MAQLKEMDYLKRMTARHSLLIITGICLVLLLVSCDQRVEIDSDVSIDTVALNGAYENFEKPSEDELREMLTDLQYYVTQEKGTEKPFDNLYWDNNEEGIYVDIVSGDPLFSSLDKYKSGTGWPSFTRPLEETNLVLLDDYSIGAIRTEVRSRQADSHIGHVFNDGPEPSGLRYCMNSAALEFIPVSALEERGYEEYLSLFAQ